MAITETAEADARPRLALFWGAALTALVIGFVATIGGATVKPLLDIPALVEQAPADPADPGGPVEPGVAAPEPTTPATADPCAAPASAYATAVCDTTSAYGWTVTATQPLAEGVAFTALVDGLPPLASGERFRAPDIVEGRVMVFTHQRDGLMTAGIEPLPAQSTAGVADEIRGALGVDAIWFFDGGNLVDGPSLYFGSGWSIATKYDAARPVGTVVTAGSRTLTVTTSDPAHGTVYRVN